MKKVSVFLFCLCLLLSAVSLCAVHPEMLANPNLPSMSYYSDRADSAHGFDITKYEIYLTINDQTHYINGQVYAHVTAQTPMTGIDYNLWGLTVSQVKVDGVVTTYTHQNGILHVYHSASAGQQFITEVDYSGTPQLSSDVYHLGMTFGANTVFTLAEPDGARFWWPCYDHTWDKALADLHITVRSDWLVASNGLRQSIVDNGNGTKTHNWTENNLMATYLVSVACGPYVEINQTAGTLPIQNFVMPSQYDNAMIDFSTLPEIIQFYETQFGPYPFEKYGNTVAEVTGITAMENQTQTTMAMSVITGTHSGELVIAHELSHMWYGDCLTPLTWKDIWLNEGFATYAELLWVHHHYSWPTAVYYVSTFIQQSYLNWEGTYGPQVIYDPAYNNIFNAQSYEKAGAVLHMLRLKLGDAHFFQLLQNWVTAHANSNVITAEFQALAEQISGQDLDQFFYQWIYHAGIPSIEYYLLRNSETGQAKIVGKTSSNTTTPFWLEVPATATNLAVGDSITFNASPTGAANTYNLSAGATNYSLSAIDPDHWLLKNQVTVADVNLTHCFSSHQAVYLEWDNFSQLPDLVGYNIYRRAENQTEFALITEIPLVTTTYMDTQVQNGTTYYYMIKAVDSQNFESFGSNTMSSTPLEFSFDSGLLVIDETRDGTGASITPDDAMVDAFYANALAPFHFTQWDYATQGPPSLSTLSHYPLILWHADDYAQNLIADCEITLSGYLLGGGKLVISGWKTAGVLSESFRAMFMGDTELLYNNSPVLISADSDLYPQLTPDPAKLLANWNGMLPMVYTFDGDAETLYQAVMPPDTEGQAMPIAIEFNNPATLVVFGFPLYFMQSAGVHEMLQDLLPAIYPPVSVQDENQAPLVLKLSAYPNPCRDRLTIALSGKSDPSASLQVFNVKGQLVANLALPKSDATSRTLVWNVSGMEQETLPAGVYLLRYTDRQQTRTVKFLHLN